MFIDLSYFKGFLQIPNLDKDPDAFEANYIDFYEREILLRLLGYDLYNQFIEGLEDATPAQKWLDLRDGKTFEVTINQATYNVRWNGLINDEKISLLSYYVYFNYIRENYQQATGLGYIESTQENAENVDPNSKLVRVWNKCSELAGRYYFKTTGENLFYLSTDGSLFNFIYTHLSDYQNWQYEPVKRMNVLGI